MVYKYSFEKFDKETMARAHGTNLQISLKKTVETVNAIRGKKLSTVIGFLEKVEEQKAVVPFRKYRSEMAHQKGKGIDTGGYPVKVATALLSLIKSAQANAKEKELTGDLYLVSISSRKGSSKYHYGRYSGRKMKSTTVEVVVAAKNKKVKAAKAKVGGNNKWLREK